MYSYLLFNGGDFNGDLLFKFKLRCGPVDKRFGRIQRKSQHSSNQNRQNGNLNFNDEILLYILPYEDCNVQKPSKVNQHVQTIWKSF